jgi:hypothetical protein
MLQTKADIQTRLMEAEAKRAKIKELFGQGKSLDEIKSGVGDPMARPTQFGPNFTTYTEVVYKELTGKS